MLGLGIGLGVNTVRDRVKNWDRARAGGEHVTLFDKQPPPPPPKKVEKLPS